MLFDQFCGVVERECMPSGMMPLCRTLAHDARLFALDANPKDVLPKSVASIETEQNAFFLPFDTVAFEDTISCVFLQNPSPGMQGLQAKRLALEVRSLERENQSDVAEVLGMPLQRFRDALLITHGYIWNVRAADNRYSYEYELHDVVLASKHEGVIDQRIGKMCADLNLAGQNALTAIEEVLWANSPEYFVFEKAVIDSCSRRMAKGRIPRSDARPTYRILHRAKIRELLGLEAEPSEGGAVTPHPRRAHRRTLRHERFEGSGKRNTQIVVKSTWVGPTEKIEGRFRYTVLVDV